MIFLSLVLVCGPPTFLPDVKKYAISSSVVNQNPQTSSIFQADPDCPEIFYTVGKNLVKTTSSFQNLPSRALKTPYLWRFAGDSEVHAVYVLSDIS